MTTSTNSSDNAEIKPSDSGHYVVLMRTHWCNFLLVSYTVFILKMILSLLFCNSWRYWTKLTSPLLEKLTLYIADEERQREREIDRGTFVMTDKKLFFLGTPFIYILRH